ncbi:insulin receptor substrate 1-like isoform X5 [Portunus trituberculatus]|uniref:insulin receptor substrate 1-like isoform X5 n=1 Tax=Portunus trituberculatus TaxID=210409 RepID=UPI001E1D088C|nr:insulin receptor substrate 1-like isoform X5 [Portunus trituberculatus]
MATVKMVVITEFIKIITTTKTTMKKKFFVLRRDSGPDHPARLEYYDNEKKFISGTLPKKPIILSTCLSINRKEDPKHNHVIALYTNHDSLSVAAESESEMIEWLDFLKHHVRQTVSGTEGQSRKMYEHVWLVAVQQRSLGSSKGLTGKHHFCLTYKSIALVRVGDCQKKIEFPLNSIRRCGHTGSFFFLGLGRSAVTGAGDIWMLTEDAVIAENMHSIIKKAMEDPCNNINEDPVSRERTKSMSNNRSFDGGGGGSCTRERCGSMPSRSRTSSEGSVQNAPNKLQAHICPHQMDGSLCPHITRPQSMYSPSLSSSYSPPFSSFLFSPGSSESVESNPSVDDMDGLPIGLAYDSNREGLYSVEEGSYMHMKGGSVESGSGFHPHSHPHPPFTLPIMSSRIIGPSLSRGLVSPVSVCGSEGPNLNSPQDNYMDMASPSERKHLGLHGLSLDHNYMCMDRQQSQTDGSSGPESSGYMSMAPLNSPGNVHPTWPSYSSSQVSSPPNSVSHSRIPSLVDENTDNYLPMMPRGHGGELTYGDVSARDRSDAYLDMTPTPAVPTPIPCSPSEDDSFPEMSPGSSCSFTSGTPSSDHRFPDFIAEKSGSGSYYGCSEDDDSSLDRPIRTNSVGSKPEQYRSRKNRLEVSPAEPARVRAFSVGSRVSLRLGGGRAGQVTSGTIGATSASITEFSPSIKEKGKQVKSKSTSAPILGSSPISNSWSGTPGTFFRGFLQARSQERNEDLMEFDFSKNKSCDSISAEKEKKSSSFESIKRTLTGQRHRSNSKSSGNGKSSVFDSIKRDKKKSESELSNKSIDLSERNRLCEVEINPSPHRKTSDSLDGYLPMKPAIPSQSLCTSEYVDMSSKESLNRHFPERYLEMSGGNDRLTWSSSSGTHEEYVDMSQGKGLGLLPITPISSGSTNTNSSSSAGARVRKMSSTLNPNLSSQHNSHMDDYMSIDLLNNLEASHSYDGEKQRKKDKRNMKRKSFKDSSRKKKSEPISVTGKSGDSDGAHEIAKKGTSPLSSFSTLWGRKNSSGTTPPKTPLSPTGSPLPKSTRGTPSPFSSLTRNKNRDDRDSHRESGSKENVGGMTSSVSSGIGTSCIKESSREAEESAISGDGSGITASLQTVPSVNEPMSKQKDGSSSGSKRSSGIFETPQGDVKEDNQAAATTELPGQNVPSVIQPSHSSSNDHGAYVNLAPGSCEKNLTVESRQRKLSDISASSDYMNISPLGSSKSSESDMHQSREYMNMCPGGHPEPAQASTSVTASQPPPTPPTPPPPPPSGSEASPTGKCHDIEKNNQESTPKSGTSAFRQQSGKDSNRLSVGCTPESDGSNEESGYLLMTPGQAAPKPLSPQTVTHRPDIPPSLLGDHSNSTLTATLERLNLNSGSNNGTERCRSHSGPGAPEGSAVSNEVRVKKQLSEPRAGSSSAGTSEKAASACSSPVSYSPPTSPTLGGSVSSVSSLSEGGLSSASSTCTVVNVGVTRREGGSGGANKVQETSGDSTVHSTAPAASSQQSLSAVGSGSKDSGLNYVSLDLGPTKSVGVRPSPRTAHRAVSGTPTPSTTTQEPVAEDEDERLSYAQIDFTKSEGLRTTSLSRDHRH